MTPYSSFLQLFANICLNHPNVTSFSVDEVEPFDLSKQTLFPLAHLVTETMEVDEGRMTYTFTLLIADRVADTNADSSGRNNSLSVGYKGVTNTIDVINTAQLTITDIFSYLKRNAQIIDYTLDDAVIITPFVEKGHNIVAGVSAQFVMNGAFNSNACLFNLTKEQASGGGGVYCCEDTNFLLQEDADKLLQEDSSNINWK